MPVFSHHMKFSSLLLCIDKSWIRQCISILMSKIRVHMFGRRPWMFDQIKANTFCMYSLATKWNSASPPSPPARRGEKILKNSAEICIFPYTLTWLSLSFSPSFFLFPPLCFPLFFFSFFFSFTSLEKKKLSIFLFNMHTSSRKKKSSLPRYCGPATETMPCVEVKSSISKV